MQYVHGRWLYLTGLFPTKFPVFNSQSGKWSVSKQIVFLEIPIISAVHSRRVGYIPPYHTALVHSAELYNGTHICHSLHGTSILHSQLWWFHVSFQWLWSYVGVSQIGYPKPIKLPCCYPFHIVHQPQEISYPYDPIPQAGPISPTWNGKIRWITACSGSCGSWFRSFAAEITWSIARLGLEEYDDFPKASEPMLNYGKWVSCCFPIVE